MGVFRQGQVLFPEGILSIPECFSVVSYNCFKPSLKCFTSEVMNLILI